MALDMALVTSLVCMKVRRGEERVKEEENLYFKSVKTHYLRWLSNGRCYYVNYASYQSILCSHDSF